MKTRVHNCLKGRLRSCGNRRNRRLFCFVLRLQVFCVCGSDNVVVFVCFVRVGGAKILEGIGTYEYSFMTAKVKRHEH